jgi:hypothetical protein
MDLGKMPVQPAVAMPLGGTAEVMRQREIPAVVGRMKGGEAIDKSFGISEGHQGHGRALTVAVLPTERFGDRSVEPAERTIATPVAQGRERATGALPDGRRDSIAVPSRVSTRHVLSLRRV